MGKSRSVNADHVVRMPTPIHGCSNVARRAAAALHRHSAIPRPPQRKITPARPVTIKMGTLSVVSGDEVTKTCLWKKETEKALDAVKNDVVKLDEVVSSEKDRVFKKRGELILGASSSSEQLRTILSETLRPSGSFGSARRGVRQKTKFDTFISEQLEKLSSLHPLGYAGLVLRQLQLTNSRAILDVSSKILFHDLEESVSRHLDNESTIRDDQSDNDPSDAPENALTFDSKIDQAVQCDIKDRQTELTSGSHLSGGKATARIHLAGLHNVAVNYQNTISDLLRMGNQSATSHDVITEDEIIVKWVQSCNNMMQQLGADISKVSLTTHLTDIKSYSMSTATSQTNLAITQSSISYLTKSITALLDFIRNYIISGASDENYKQKKT